MMTNPIIFETREGRLDLTASVMKVGQDLVVVIFGGERHHIGAVALAQPRQSLKNPEKTSATASVLCLLGHKEDVIVKSVSERLAAVAHHPVVVTAGMHWDNMQESDLGLILRNLETLMEMIESYLRTSSCAAEVMSE
jgi:gallate decarboxylase subunit D